MSLFLIIAFLFFVGSVVGWLLELVFRKFFSKTNPEHKWVNPGFLVGPYLPLYGFSLCSLFLLAQIDVSFIENPIVQKIVLFSFMALAVTIIEYFAGLIFIKGMKIKLWDYSKEWKNIQGIICPLFSFFWAILSAIYYFLIHPYIMNSLYWLAENLSFSFVVGFFYGIFVIDFSYSMNLLSRIRKFATENQIIVRYESLKESIRKKNFEMKEKRQFLLPLRSINTTFAENLKSYLEKEHSKIRTEYLQKKEQVQQKLDKIKKL